MMLDNIMQTVEQDWLQEDVELYQKTPHQKVPQGSTVISCYNRP